jgi:2-polyprenyl-6-methoxyphenol hydroxylase-like FAD-dependent oxidoreductase
MDSWHKGRVVLVGDSAWCATIYAGMGASLGLAGAELLGTMLQRHPEDIESALTRWERRLRPLTGYCQHLAHVQVPLFVAAKQRDITRFKLMQRAMRLPAAGPVLKYVQENGKSQRMKDTDIAAA